MTERKYKVVPSEDAGYTPGQWIVRYYDANIRRWFDVGDPLPKADAEARLAQLRAGERPTTDNIHDSTVLPKSDDMVEYRLKSGGVGQGRVGEAPWKQNPRSDVTWVIVGDDTINWNEVSAWWTVTG